MIRCSECVQLSYQCNRCWDIEDPCDVVYLEADEIPQYHSTPCKGSPPPPQFKYPFGHPPIALPPPTSPGIQFPVFPTVNWSSSKDTSFSQSQSDDPQYLSHFLLDYQQQNLSPPPTPAPSAATPVEEPPAPAPVPAPSAATPVEESEIPFGERPTPPPSPKRRPQRSPPPLEEQEDVLTPINLFQRTPPLSLSFEESPSFAPFYLLNEPMAPPTATEEVHDLGEPVEEEEDEHVFLDPLKMDAGSTPFRRKRKAPSCKRSDRSGGWVKIRILKNDLIF